ncbi:MAG: hypothetical protein IKV56_02715, partial [Kiritimatiellae bacterium]|nr:hypothetical protein [Kiritimatiellia bacterium]
GEKAALSGVEMVLSDSASGEAADYKSALMDSIAESDEELMMKYLDAGELTPLEYLEIREEILALALENVKWKRAVTLAREELAKYKVTLED